MCCVFRIKLNGNKERCVIIAFSSFSIDVNVQNDKWHNILPDNFHFALFECVMDTALLTTVEQLKMHGQNANKMLPFFMLNMKKWRKSKMSVNQTNIISEKIFITPGKGIGSPISNRNIVLILVQFRKKSNTLVQHLVNFERDQRKRVALNFSKELNQPHLFL